MKKLLASLFLLVGCQTTQGFQSKYYPGDCALAKPEYLAAHPDFKDVEAFVYAVTTKGYHVVYVLPLLGPINQGQVDRADLDDNSDKIECSATSKKLLPENKKGT